MISALRSSEVLAEALMVTSEEPLPDTLLIEHQLLEEDPTEAVQLPEQVTLTVAVDAVADRLMLVGLTLKLTELLPSSSSSDEQAQNAVGSAKVINRPNMNFFIERLFKKGGCCSRSTLPWVLKLCPRPEGAKYPW